MVAAERLKRERFIEARRYLKATGTVIAFESEAKRLKEEGHTDTRVSVGYPPEHPADSHEEAYWAQVALTVWDENAGGRGRYHWDIATCGVVLGHGNSFLLDFKRKPDLVNPLAGNLEDVFREVSWQPDSYTKRYDHTVWEERLITAVCVPIMIAALIKDGVEATGSALARTAIRSYNRSLAKYWPV